MNTVEVETREPLTADQVDAVMSALEKRSPAIGTSARGWQSSMVGGSPALDVAGAGIRHGAGCVDDALGTPPIAVEVITTEEFDARQGWDSTTTDLISVREAAELLGVSRQRVLQRIADKSLPAEKVGRDYGIPRSAVEARAKS